MNPHFLLLEQAERTLSALNRRMVFVGGATISLHIDDPATGPIRATKDVDLVVEVSGYPEFSALEQQLRDHGFEQNVLDDSPICRWEKGDLLIDIIPTKPELIGFKSSRWFKLGFERAQRYELPTGTTIEAFDVLHLMAAKIEAFEDRGDGDWQASRDIEDLATILDGRTTIFDELATDTEPAVFVRNWLNQCDALGDRLRFHVDGYSRANYLVEQLRYSADSHG